MSNSTEYTCSQLQESEYFGVPFADVPVDCCRPTPVNALTADLHLFGFECNNNWRFFAAVICLTCFIKVFQNFLFTSIGQLERELMQEKSGDRKFRGGEYGVFGKKCPSKCERFNFLSGPKFCGKLGYLIWLEIVAGVVGVLSILIITGNNAWIWMLGIVFNAVGVYLSLKNTKPDHHSPAAAFLNLVQNATQSNDLEEHKKAKEALKMLKTYLSSIEPEVPELPEVPEVPEVTGKNSVRKRLVL